MKPAVCLTLLGLFWAGCVCPLPAQDRYAAHIVPTDPLPAEEQQTKFKLPPGFEIQLVAAEPQIQKPINLQFDHQGRLWVTDTIEYPYAVEQGKPSRDTVKILSINDQTGRAENVTTFAENLNIPIGLAPLSDGAIVFSIPSIYRCWDDDGDSQADRREQLFGPFGQRDTHGLNNGFTRGLDGWIYACHGFSNSSTIQGQDGQRVSMQSGNTYRFRPDGSQVRQYTHGQVNPFGMCFDAWGNLYTADCHSKPAYQLVRGAYYPSFGKPHDGLGFGPEIIRHSHGSTGIAGIVYYAADQFPEEYRDSLFIGNPITHRINHDRLKRFGSSYQGIEQPDFLSCEDRWFRPVDVQLGPDGALYIADFYNCIIGHYEVPLDHPKRDRHRGRIWRIVYKGEPLPSMVKVAGRPVEELISLLGHANLTVRTQASHELMDRQEPQIASAILKAFHNSDTNKYQRAHSLWVLEHYHALHPEHIHKVFAESSPLVVTHLLKVLGEREQLSDKLADLLRSGTQHINPFVRRAAAAALGQHPDAKNLTALLELWAVTPAEDTHLVHTTRIALRDQLLAPGIYETATKLAKNQQHADRLAEVSLGVRDAPAAEFLSGYLRTYGLQAPRVKEYAHHLIRYSSELPKALKVATYWPEATQVQQAEFLLVAVKALQERGAKRPESLLTDANSLAKQLLDSKNPAQRLKGFELVSTLRLTSLQKDLLSVVKAEADSQLRSAAMDACIVTEPQTAIPILREVIADDQEPLNVRQKAAQALATANNNDARHHLLELLRTAPSALAVEIAAGLAANRPGGEALIAAIERGTASRRLLTEKRVVSRLRSARVPNLNETIARLTEGLPPADSRLNKLILTRREGFHSAEAQPDRGAFLFRKHCANCHKIDDQGNKIGPELDGIGLRGVDRLVEDLLDPSRNVDAAFRSVVITTVDGRVVNGLPLREEGNVLVLANAEGKEVRIPSNEIDERTESPLSPMPANVSELMNEAEFYDLLGYLLQQQQQSTQP